MPIILLLFLEDVIISMKRDSKTWGMKTLRSSLILKCKFSFKKRPTPPPILSVRVRVMILWNPGKFRRWSLLQSNTSIMPKKSKEKDFAKAAVIALKELNDNIEKVLR